MARFYTKNWFPYVFPFLLCFTLAQAAIYVPDWSLHLTTAKIFLGGGLVWGWRKKFLPELNTPSTKKQTLISISFGLTGGAVWLLSQHYKLISFQPNNIPTQWPITLEWVVTLIFILGSVVIMPIISEIFWRSFMLRYLIVQDFKSIALGTFQFFSCLGVIVLTAIPSEYVVAVAAVSTLQNILIFWQKNLRCCIISSVVTHALLIMYLIRYNYQLM